jgi:large subunit ribosomal protein L29
MKAKDLRAMTNAELVNKLDDSHQELFNLRFQRVTGQLANPARIREVRRDIARIMTILRERELAVEA